MDLQALQTADRVAVATTRSQTGARGADTASRTFADALQTASRTTATPKADAATDAKTVDAKADAKPADAEVRLRKHETLQRIEGRGYSEIDGGRRDGLYVNTSGNSRHGETFTMTIRDGRQFHIYGTGADRVVVSMPVKRDTPAETSATGGAAVPTASRRD